MSARESGIYAARRSGPPTRGRSSLNNPLGDATFRINNLRRFRSTRRFRHCDRICDRTLLGVVVRDPHRAPEFGIIDVRVPFDHPGLHADQNVTLNTPLVTTLVKGIVLGHCSA
jgi:hypothetical protein